ncbi:MAG: hypothetical protein WAK84_01525 [Candidatus Cybelea sp.]
MKTIAQTPYALSVCVAAAMLASCGGSTFGSFPNPAMQMYASNAGTQPPPSHAKPFGRVRNSSGADSLTGTAKLGQCHFHYIFQGNIVVGEAYRTNFHAHGHATGPDSGYFVANGHWGFSYYEGLAFWKFVERFTIKSGASPVSGTIRAGGVGGGSCTSFGPEIVPYGSGKANIETIQQGTFSETLDGL